MLLAALVRCHASMQVLTSARLLCASLEQCASLMVPPRVGAAGQEEAGQQHAAAGQCAGQAGGHVACGTHVLLCMKRRGSRCTPAESRCKPEQSPHAAPAFDVVSSHIRAQRTAPASSCQPVSALVLLVLARRAAPSAVLRACVECAQSGALTLTLYLSLIHI